METNTRTICCLVLFAVTVLPIVMAVDCKQAPDTGPCLANMVRWAFDSSKGKCVPFPYGGCNGNSNNFLTLKACTSSCSNVRFYANRRPRTWMWPKEPRDDNMLLTSSETL
ncbi:amyloid-beta precursor protein-like isoform X1 [Asterias amurensis]|uniref:amyloid-beta precursor protein-like isoform X1 n=2 Tax=Asterias amurensis TaxID=7602 RepID=UPI003AB5D3EE